jgi:predicted lipoprotein with Yx(FWY)xxD motif
MSAFRFTKLGLGVAGAVTAVLTLVAGCGSSSSSGNPAASKSFSGLKTTSTSIGTVLVDPSGRTVYELVGDTAAKQTCTGGCLAIWPAVMTNGKQMIVNGHPAFTYAGDTSAGQTKGQNLTDQWGRWLALDASGNPISAAGSKSSAGTSKAPSGGSPAF